MDRLDQLMAFLRFPSISAQAAHAEDVSECADWLVSKLHGMGFVAQKHATALHPIVVAHGPEVPGKPRVLIYGHYDVQPVDPLEQWLSDPFEPEIRDGRIYARGASDDKGEICAHLLGVEELMRQECGNLPLNVSFIFEGEEEIGSKNLAKFMREHQEELACDVIVISDTGMAAENTPTYSYGLRGMACAELSVNGPRADLHSGVFGGAVANPITVLARLIDSCHDAEGRVAIDGFYDDVMPIASWERSMWSTVPGMGNDDLAKLVGVEKLTPEADFTGVECMCGRPTLELNGIGGGYQGEGSKTIIPSKAFAKISCRLVPGQNPDRILDLLETHFQNQPHDGTTLKYVREHGGEAYISDPHSEFGTAAQQALEESFGSKPVLLREGGSIPIVNEFKKILGADSLLLGLCLPDAGIHSPNENLRVSIFEKGIEMSQCLLRRLAQIKVEK
ncbi:MAG: dipeptidase [Akkermansia sp.]